MSFNVRPATEADLILIASWFENVKWPLPAVDNTIPRVGFICDMDGVPTACAYLDLSGTAKGEVLWTAMNPDAMVRAATAAMCHLIKKIQEDTEKINVNLLRIMTKSDAFSEAMRSVGFRAERGFIQLTWVRKANGGVS